MATTVGARRAPAVVVCLYRDRLCASHAARSANVLAMIRTPSRTLASALVLGLAGGLLAQDPGTDAPEIEFAKTWNDAPSSWDELHGKLVLLDFGETW